MLIIALTTSRLNDTDSFITYRAGIDISEVKANLERNLEVATGQIHRVDVERLKPKYDNYSSFKITCVCNDTSVLMNPSIWPQGNFVREWLIPRQSKTGIIGSSQQPNMQYGH